MSIPSLNTYALPTVAEFPTQKAAWQLEPDRSVLLIHDMQRYFLRFWGDASPLVAQLTAHLVTLRDWAHARGVPVVYTAQPVEQSQADRALLNDLWGPGLTVADPALAAVVEPLTPQPQDTVLTKWRYSAFQRSPLQDLLREWGRDQLLIGGVYAHIGCMMTAVDAFMRDIQPFMVGDAVADFCAEDHRMALQYVAGRCGRVVSTAEVAALQPAALGWERFRATVLAHLPEAGAELDGDENLMDYGLDSVLVMSLAAEWSRQGMAVSFEDLARKPSLNAWWAVLSRPGACSQSSGASIPAYAAAPSRATEAV